MIAKIWEQKLQISKHVELKNNKLPNAYDLQSTCAI